MDPDGADDGDLEGPPSPAQSGQDNSPQAGIDDEDAGSEAGPAPGPSNAEAAGNASGSDQLDPQPGTSGYSAGAAAASSDDQVDDGGPQPGPSSDSRCSVSGSSQRFPFAAVAAGNIPDDGSNSGDFWAASSSGGPSNSASASNDISHENSPESEAASEGAAAPQPGGQGAVAPSAPLDQQPSGSGAASSSFQPAEGLRVVVSLASFSPQPSSSSGPSSAGPSSAGPSSAGPSSAGQSSAGPSSAGPSSAGFNNGGGPSQSSSFGGSGNSAAPSILSVSSASSAAAAAGGASSSSSSYAPAGLGMGLSSSSSPNRQQRNGAISSSANELVRANPHVVSMAESAMSSSGHRPPSPGLGPSGLQPLHGEISNPPSPLGGSRPQAAEPGRGTKRDYPDSPIPGPSGQNSNKRALRQEVGDEPIPGPSGLGLFGNVGGSGGGGGASNSSEAAAAVPLDDEDDMDEDLSSVSSPPRSSPPIHAPLTPADNFMISSSTGLVDSVPPTPVDIHGDNDLSVPSPSASGPARSAPPRREADDMVDSTVDSTGMSLERGQPCGDYSEASEFCQSSRYLDSSDDDDDVNMEVQASSGGPSSFPVPTGSGTSRQQQGISQPPQQNDDSISTSGQVDEGQFRLVPNDPEDDFFNQSHPPRLSGRGGGGGPGSSGARQGVSSNSGSSRSLYDDPQPGPSKGWRGKSSSSSTTASSSSSAPVARQPPQHVRGAGATNHAKAPPLAAVPSSSGPKQPAPASFHLYQEPYQPPPPPLPTVPSNNHVQQQQPLQQQERGQREKSNQEPQPGNKPADSPGNLDGLLPCPDMPLDGYAAAGPSSSSSAPFQAIPDPGGGPPFGQPPVDDLDGIQLQKFVPEQAGKPNEAAPVPPGNNGVPGFALPDVSDLKPEPPPQQPQAQQHQQSHAVPLLPQPGPSGLRTNGLSGLGGNDREAIAGTSGSGSQHSSILESMTGPLSKRLRTLHSMQQRQSTNAASESSPPAPAASSSQVEATVRVLPAGQSGVKRTKNNNNEAAAAAPQAEGHHQQSPPLGGNHDSDSNHSNNGNGNGGCNFFGGPTSHQSYNVTIEPVNGLPPSVINMKPKRMMPYEKKGKAEKALWEDPEPKKAILPEEPRYGVQARPRRTAKQTSKVLSNAAPATFQITDAPVQSRARASLPSGHLAIKEVKDKDLGKGVGVFAKRRIPKGCRFGPVEGVLRGSDSEEAARLRAEKNRLVLLVIADEVSSVVDTTDDDTSNWMKFVRMANSPFEQNLLLHQENGQIFFVASRSINPRQELRVSYSPGYAAERNLPCQEVIEDEGDENLWPCFECNKKLPSSEELQSHLDEHEGRQGKATTGSGGRKNNVKAPKRTNRLPAIAQDPLSTPPERKQVKVLLPETADDVEAPRPQTHPMADPSNRCTKCGLWFRLPSVYRVHLFAHHPEKSRQNLTVEDALAQAKDGQGGDRAAAAEEMKFQCPECLAQYDAWLDLVSHVGGHGAMAGPPRPEERSRPTPTAEAPASKHKCGLCYKTFAAEDRLRRHMVVHGEEEDKPLACHHCGKRFLNNSALACHVKVHAADDDPAVGGGYDCPICGAAFEAIVSLKEHVHTHCVDGQYACPNCNKSFNEYSLVRKHIRSFHGEKKHVCRHCSKSFASADKLRIHIVVHSDRKEFLCNDCGKQFKRKDKLREHVMRMHSEQPEEDPGGLQSSPAVTPREPKFVPKVSPTDYHRFIYKCHECRLGFKRRGMLVNHLAKRHPEISPEAVPELNLPILKATKDYYCQYCNKVYKSSSKRKVHIIKNHPGQKLPQSARAKKNGAGGHAASLEVANPTFSATVGSITSQPHRCQHCHKQYASNAKLLQHQRKKHREMMPPDKQMPRTAAATAARPDQQQQVDPVYQDPAFAHLDGIVVQQEHQQAAPVPNGLQMVSFDEVLVPAPLAGPSSSSQSAPLFGEPAGGQGELLSLARVPHQEMVRLASNGATILQVASPRHQQQPEAGPSHQQHFILTDDDVLVASPPGPRHQS